MLQTRRRMRADSVERSRRIPVERIAEGRASSRVLGCATHAVSCAAARGWRFCGQGLGAKIRSRGLVWKSKTLAGLFGLQMAKGDGQGVRGIGRFRRFVHFEERAHH